MNDEVIARAMTLIVLADEIHRACDNHYITVSVSRTDAGVFVSRFIGGGQYTRSFSTRDYISEGFIYDPDLTKAAAYLQMLLATIQGGE